MSTPTFGAADGQEPPLGIGRKTALNRTVGATPSRLMQTWVLALLAIMWLSEMPGYISDGPYVAESSGSIQHGEGIQVAAQ